MVGVDKKKLSDLFKKTTDKKEEVKEEIKTTKPTAATPSKSKSTSYTLPTSGTAKKTAPKAGQPNMEEVRATLDARKKEKADEASRAKQAEILKTKTHQDLINAVYKIAEELKSEGGPWPILRAAGWGKFTDDRGALYKGPIIDDLEKLTDEQKAALKKQLGI